MKVGKEKAKEERERSREEKGGKEGTSFPLLHIWEQSYNYMLFYFHFLKSYLPLEMLNFSRVGEIFHLS